MRRFVLHAKALARANQPTAASIGGCRANLLPLAGGWWRTGEVLADPGREHYKKRHQTIEPVFGQIKFNRRIDRFLRRGRKAARSEWRLATATHNLLKLHQHHLATIGA